MTTSPSNFEKFRREFDIVEVARRLGLTVATKNSAAIEGRPIHQSDFIACPVHADIATSCLLQPTGYWHCFGCFAHGNVVGLVQTVRGGDIIDAVTWLSEEFGVEKPAQDG